MDFGKAHTDAVIVPERLRAIDPAKVKALAESMAEIGLQQPISVWSPNSTTCNLVAGYHRLLAARQLKWNEIDCVFVEMEDLDRQLWEIDENLCRVDLTDAERAEHTAKRAEIFRQKAECAKLAQTKPDASKNADKGQGEFIEETAQATGKSTRSVKRDKSRGEKIAPDVMRDIQGTGIENSGVQLDALEKVDHEQQRAAVKQVNLGQEKDVRDALDPNRMETESNKKFEAIKRAWLNADDEAKDMFWNWLDPLYIPATFRRE